MSYKQPYQVAVRDKIFTLSREQITFEAGNAFEQFYLLKSPGSLAGNNNVYKSDRHPGSFAIIVDHLSGYDVLPLSDEECYKAGMDRDRLLRYLASDALFYYLPSLAEKTKKEMIRLRAEEIKASKQISETQTEIAKLQAESEKLKLEKEQENLKAAQEHEMKILELQHMHARYFKRLELLVERARTMKDTMKDLDYTPTSASPAFTSPVSLTCNPLWIVCLIGQLTSVLLPLCDPTAENTDTRADVQQYTI
jgi:hypothetical protein